MSGEDPQRLRDEAPRVTSGIYSFRHRFRVSQHEQSGLDQAQYLVYEDDQTTVWLSEGRGQALTASEWWVIHGAGYPSEEAAASAASKWVGRLERALALAHRGADFGRRDPHPLAQMAGHMHASDFLGVPVFQDEHGLMVYEDGLGTILLGGSGTVTITQSPKRLLAALTSELSQQVHDSQARAFELYSAACFSKSTEGSFMLNMMAVEALMDRRKRRSEVGAYVDQALSLLAETDLTEDEKVRLSGGISILRSESSHEQGRRLARDFLPGREYRGQTAEEFFTTCYRLRGNLAHPSKKGPPDPREVSSLNRVLRSFVGDLIAGLELSNADNQASAPEIGV